MKVARIRTDFTIIESVECTPQELADLLKLVDAAEKPRPQVPPAVTV